MVIVFKPVVSGISPERPPAGTTAPLTVIVTEADAPIGVTVIDFVSSGTVAVYSVMPPAQAGLKVPALSRSPKSSTSEARLTVTV